MRPQAIDTPKTYPANGFLQYCEKICKKFSAPFDAELSSVMVARSSCLTLLAGSQLRCQAKKTFEGWGLANACRLPGDEGGQLGAGLEAL